ncbi:MAG: glcD [Erysipelotrichaceae bacterium]|nr:MAG: hypothetical protein FD179_1476 [Erysipelotrichaceae bacterium]TXT17140.1 MAG: glcD [Erysipelotrichaceae bacterium]
MYKNIDQNDIEFLTQLLGKDRVLTTLPDGFNRDEMPIYGEGNGEVAVYVLTTQEVSAILKYANTHHIAVTTRGSGTGLVGACVPLHGGIILSTVKMNKILSIDPTTMTAVVEPGVLLMKLATETESRSLMYPPDPGEKSATIGGNAATNAGGMRAIKYGVTREYIKSLEVVLASGEIVDLGKAVSKNSSGYALKDLMIGSEGTLGVITKLTLKLIPKPALNVSLLVPFDDIATCLNAVQEIVQLPDVCTTLEFMEKEVLDDAKEYLGKDFPDRNYPAYLIVTYSASSQIQLDAMIEQASTLLRSLHARDIFLSDTVERQAALWNTRGAFLEAIKNSTSLMDEADVVLKITRIADYLAYIKQLEAKTQVRIRTFGHAGDGNLHVYVCKDKIDDERWQVVLPQIMDALYQKAAQEKGAVSGEHGIGHAKKAYLIQSVGETQIELMHSIKNVFDPKGILNPNKVIDLK